LKWKLFSIFSSKAPSQTQFWMDLKPSGDGFQTGTPLSDDSAMIGTKAKLKGNGKSKKKGSKKFNYWDPNMGEEEEEEEEGDDEGQDKMSLDNNNNNNLKEEDKDYELVVQVFGEKKEKKGKYMTRLQSVQQLFHAFVNRSQSYNYPTYVGLILFSE